MTVNVSRTSESDRSPLGLRRRRCVVAPMEPPASAPANGVDRPPGARRGRAMNRHQLAELSPYVLLAILFVVPFVDPRRPFRLLHLDIFVLTSFGLYAVALLDRGPTVVSTHWAMIVASRAGSTSSDARSRPYFGQPGRPDLVSPVSRCARLKWAIVVFMSLRLLFPFVDDRLVIDVGLASVGGAQQILEATISTEQSRTSTRISTPTPTGPLTTCCTCRLPGQYPRRSTPPWSPDAFDPVDPGGVIAVRPMCWGAGGDGRALGLLLGHAWATSPYAFFTSIWAYNDMLVPMFLVYIMISLSSPGAAACSGRSALRRSPAGGSGAAHLLRAWKLPSCMYSERPPDPLRSAWPYGRFSYPTGRTRVVGQNDRLAMATRLHLQRLGPVRVPRHSARPQSGLRRRADRRRGRSPPPESLSDRRLHGRVDRGIRALARPRAPRRHLSGSHHCSS